MLDEGVTTHRYVLTAPAKSTGTVRGRALTTGDSISWDCEYEHEARWIGLEMKHHPLIDADRIVLTHKVMTIWSERLEV